MTRIAFVTPANLGTASLRYRAAIPAKYLRAKGYKVSIGPGVPDDATVCIFSKHFEDHRDKARTAKKLGKRVIFDICDDHRQTEMRDYYADMAKIAHVIVASTPMIAEAYKAKHVIPDPYEQPEKEPDFDRDQGLVWFGHKSNAQALIDVLPQINGYREMLTVVSDISIPGIKCLPWTPNTQRAAMDAATISIIPSAKPGAGANRMIESIRRGLFVVATPIDSYQEFRGGAWLGDIREGVEYALANKGTLADKVSRAQKYVRLAYNPEAVGAMWERAVK